MLFPTGSRLSSPRGRCQSWTSPGRCWTPVPMSELCFWSSMTCSSTGNSAVSRLSGAQEWHCVLECALMRAEVDCVQSDSVPLCWSLGREKTWWRLSFMKWFTRCCLWPRTTETETVMVLSSANTWIGSTSPVGQTFLSTTVSTMRLMCTGSTGGNATGPARTASPTLALWRGPWIGLHLLWTPGGRTTRGRVEGRTPKSRSLKDMAKKAKRMGRPQRQRPQEIESLQVQLQVLDHRT